MKIIGLDGKEYDLSLGNNSKRRKAKKSKYHIKAREFLKQKFPNDTILEELTLPGTKTNNTELLYCDFFIPRIPMIVEVHGEQHYNFIPFFHKTKMNFLLAKKKDLKKKEWCEINDIQYLELKWDEEWDDYEL